MNIYLDGEFAFGLARIVAAWLKVGEMLNEEKISALQVEDEREVVYQKALHFLSYRPRSAAEVRTNLNRHGVAEALVNETVVRLQRNGLLNDAEFARLWIENRNTFRPRSKAALRMELRQKGVSEEIIQPLLETDVDEEQLARQAAQKYLRKVEGLEWQEFRNKLGGFLARRGFSYNIIAPLLSEIWQEMAGTAEAGETDEE